MTATLAEAKTLLRIDGTESDARLRGFLDAANLAVAEASGVTDWTSYPNLRNAALMLTGIWFDSDDVAAIKQGIPPAVAMLIDMSRTGWVKS